MKKSELKALIREVVQETEIETVSYHDAISTMAKDEAQRYINSGNTTRMKISDDVLDVIAKLFRKQPEQVKNDILLASRKELSYRAGSGNWKKSV